MEVTQIIENGEMNETILFLHLHFEALKYTFAMQGMIPSRPLRINEKLIQNTR